MTIEIPNIEEFGRLKHLYDQAFKLETMISGLENQTGKPDCRIELLILDEDGEGADCYQISSFGIHEKAVEVMLPILRQQLEIYCFEISISATFHAPKIINTGD